MTDRKSNWWKAVYLGLAIFNALGNFTSSCVYFGTGRRDLGYLYSVWTVVWIVTAYLYWRFKAPKKRWR